MKLNISDVAVYETRTVSAADLTGFGDSIRYQRGWWHKATGRFLGTNRWEAEDAYAIEYAPHPLGRESISWTR